MSDARFIDERAIADALGTAETGPNLIAVARDAHKAQQQHAAAFTNDNALRDLLESLIDAKGLWEVLDAISDVCSEKEQHILSAWQDRELARKWHACAVAIVKANEKSLLLP